MSKAMTARGRKKLLGLPLDSLGVLCLAPWLLLSLTNGGRHNHLAGDMQRAAYGRFAVIVAPECNLPGGPTIGSGLRTRDAAFCPACFWQLSSSICELSSALMECAPAPISLPLTRPLPAFSSPAAAFDPRAPPSV